ncbi:MAG: isochorismatase family protein [Candidatus Aenigmarchaeota archaeon]|nr:isochorismatase family protein [Candidatus Aenigmarchaeota archaeon]
MAYSGELTTLSRLPSAAYRELPSQYAHLLETPPQYARGLAVLITDMQSPDLEAIGGENRNRLISAQGDLLELCIPLQIPTIVLEYRSRGSAMRGPTIEPLASLAKLTPSYGRVEKKWDNAFCDTELARMLQERETQTVILAGIKASSCLKSTGEGAIREGFKIATSGDLIADPPDWKLDCSRAWYKTSGIYEETMPEMIVQCMAQNKNTGSATRPTASSLRQ